MVVMTLAVTACAGPPGADHESAREDVTTTHWTQVAQQAYPDVANWVDADHIAMNTNGGLAAWVINLTTLTRIDSSTLEVEADEPAETSCSATSVITTFEAPLPSGLDLTKPIQVVLEDAVYELPVYKP
jgi:hypothetical protein